MLMICTKCNRELEDHWFDVNTKTGVRKTICRSCTTKAMTKHHRKYNARHPEVNLTASAQYRVKSQGVEGTFTPQQWKAKLKEYGHHCAYCNTLTVDLTIDHIVPISRGGVHEASNIAPACLSCNSSKKDRDLLEFLGTSGFEDCLVFKHSPVAAAMLAAEVVTTMNAIAIASISAGGAG